MNAKAMLTALFVFAGVLGAIFPAFSQQSPPDSEKAKQVVALVDKAAAMLDKQGSSGFAEFRKAGGEWQIGEIYLFVGDMNGKALFNGGFPKLEGTDTVGLKDSNGKLFVVEMLRVAKSNGSGWVDYMWPKPGQSQSSQKWSYIKAANIGGTPGYVGAGFYP